MEKKTAVSIFGTQAAMARALGITPQAVHQWPDPLPQSYVDRVVGAAIRMGKLPQLLSIQEVAA